MAKHFRSPIFDVFRVRSPFTGLFDHANKLVPCLDALQEATKVYWEGGDIQAAAQKVSKLELEADHVKSNVRNHLPGSVRMPVEKPLFLQLLSEQDRILDYAEDVAQWMAMRPPQNADAFRADLEALLAKSRETVEVYVSAVENLHDLLETGFVLREREQEKSIIHRVHELEHDVDVLEHALSARLLDPAVEKDLSAVTIAHLLKLTALIGSIADVAENAADRLRAMMAR